VTKQHLALRFLHDVLALNSRVKQEVKEGKPVYTGDATELGLHRYCDKAIPAIANGQTLDSYCTANEKVYEIPFNSSNKWQLSIHSMTPSYGTDLQPSTSSEILLFKGAPDVLLAKCSHYMNQTGEIVPINNEFEANYNTVYEDFGGNGERVLGFAFRFMDKSIADETALDENFLESLKDSYVAIGERRDLVFAGLTTLMDPARPEVPKAVAECQTAGIRVVMVTGDHHITAEAIARNIGLMSSKTKSQMAKERGVSESEIPEDEVKAAVIHGTNITALSDDDWKALALKPEIVFSRTSPEQKLMIVKKFTEAGHIVAMTGDGVNDSPALKQAAIGIAMGLNGSDVAREAADVVLLDDNFASIVIGVREGRLLFSNLKKSIAYTLTHLLPEVLPVLLWAFIGFPQTINSIQILFIDLWTELAPASSLAFEKAEDNIMTIPPRNPKKDKLVTLPLMLYSYVFAGGLITGICYFVTYLVLDQYELTFADFAKSNNDYFTTDPSKDYVSIDGRVYSKNTQTQILETVQASWYLTIVICQAVNVWCCKSRISSLYDHGMFANKYCNIGVVIAIILGILVVYCPGFTYISQSRYPPSLIMFYAALVAIGAILGLTELRKLFTRTYPDAWINKIIAW
jgi:magnesium-transporting ATPase (P-type)